MLWALGTLLLVAIGAAHLLSTLRAIHRAEDEDAHYRLSIRFWASLAVLGGLLVVMFARPLLSYGVLATDVGRLTAGLVSVLPAVVISVGLRNALSLARARRRRLRALAEGVSVPGRVIDRMRRVLAQDLMSVVVEVDLPDPVPVRELAYRARDPRPSRRARLVETCPGDHWGRFAEGGPVTVKVLPGQPDTFAVLLFGSPAQ